MVEALGAGLGSGHYKRDRARQMQVSRITAKGELMANDDRPVLIYTTFPSLDDAKRVGDALVAARLAACVNMFPGMISIFEWKGVREEADEVAMIIKTRSSLAETVFEETKRLHPYKLPALLLLPTEGGSAEYCGWIASQTASIEPK
jgi:periplasmic divalent cation tolerance protein